MYISGINLTKIGNGGDTDADKQSPEFALGQIGMTNDGKIYKYCRYSEEAAAVDGVAGEVAYYVAGTGYAITDVTSDLSAADTTPVGAGVLQASLSDNECGWMQIKGHATLSIAITGTTADGNALTPTGANDGSLDVVVTTVALAHICAYAADESANEIMCDFLF